MISYYELLGMIKKGNNIPEKVKYDNEMFVWCGGYYYNGDKGSYITDVMYEEDMFCEKVEIIKYNKKIEKIKMNGNEYYSEYIDSWIKKENTEAYCEYLSNKINEIIEVLNEKGRNDENER